MGKSKLAIVTGAAKGIGRSIALQLANDGFDLVVSDLNKHELESLVIDIKSLGQKSSSYQVNVTDKESVFEMVDDVYHRFKSVDVMVANAGIVQVKSMLDISEEDMDSIFKVNVYGVLFCMQAAAKYMMKQKSGRIINASSTSGIRGLEYLGHYAGTKFAVIGMTQSFAKELSSYGITVNAYCPGLINTDMSTLIDEEIEKLTDRSMINQVGDPKDVANVVSFLASEKSKYISGQSLVVNGGNSL